MRRFLKKCFYVVAGFFGLIFIASFIVTTYHVSEYQAKAKAQEAADAAAPKPPSSPEETKQLALKFSRGMTADGIEKTLLAAGIDVQVAFDDDHLMIIGKSVDRPFAFNFMRNRDFSKAMKGARFATVTFMDSRTFPDFIQKYSVN